MFNTSNSFKSAIFDPQKGGVFWPPPFSRFFLEFFPKLSKIHVSRFLLNAWSLWTLLCRCRCITREFYLLLDWPSITITLPLHSTLSIPCHLRISRSSFDSSWKTPSDPITPHFSFTRSSQSNACLLRATADTRSCPNRGVYPLLLSSKEVCPWSSITLHSR